MLGQEDDPPLELEKAADKFGEFLSSNGYPSRLRWITADQIALGDEHHLFISTRGAEDALAEAKRRYELGFRNRLGIMLQAIGATPDESIVSVYIPVDAADAQYRRIFPCLKFSCLTTMNNATAVDDLSEWEELKRQTRTGSKLLTESFDL